MTEQVEMLMVLCEVVIGSLQDVNNEPVPESTFYIAFGMDMDRWQTVKLVLLSTGMIEVKNHLVRLTIKGLAVKVA